MECLWPGSTASIAHRNRIESAMESAFFFVAATFMVSIIDGLFGFEMCSLMSFDRGMSTSSEGSK